MFDTTLLSLHLEFVLDRTPQDNSFEKSSYPFVHLAEGHYYQIVLTKIITESGQTCGYVPLKMQRNHYAVSPLSESRETNITIGNLWERELHAQGIVTQEYKEPSIDPRSLLRTWQQPSNPITFCKKKKVCFHPICPDCFALLTDCRNDTFLAQKSLPTYSNSISRFICCPHCTGTAENPPLYAFLPSETEKSTGVKNAEDLYQDLQKIFTLEWDRQSDESKKVVAERFPCFTCENRTDCYPEKHSPDTPFQAGGQLTPITFYDSYIIPLDMFHLPYDDFSHLLGGMRLENRETSTSFSPLSQGRHFIRNLIEPHLQSTCSFLFGDDDSGLHALEIFKLKIDLFYQLSTGVREIHARCGHPHLDIRPDNVWVTILHDGSTVPRLWNFKTTIFNLGCAVPFTPANDEEEFFSEIFYPPEAYEQTYTSPLIHTRTFGHQEHVRLTIQNISETTQPGLKDSYIFDASIETPPLLPNEITSKDVLHIFMLRESIPIDLWCKKIDQEGTKIYIRSHNTPLQEKDAVTFKTLIGQPMDVQLCVYPTYHVPCDLYSLGMMFFASLLINESQSFQSIRECIDRVSTQMKLYAHNHPQALEQDYAHYLYDLLGSEENRKIISQDNIFYAAGDASKRLNTIPSNVWYEALGIGFRLVTQLPSFSFCQNYADYELGNSEKKIDYLLEMVSNVRAQIHTELFSFHHKNAEVLEVIGECVKALSNPEAKMVSSE